MTEKKLPNAGDEKIIALEEEILEELIELEEWVKAKKKPRKAKKYIIRIDKEKITVSVHSMTGREILALVNKTPDKFKLHEWFPGHVEKEIKPEEIVEFYRCEVERFMTNPREATEG
ncbi:hypothetical protein [Methanoregula sp.]|uniref:hypothetical protein n=1 Tax=Methanoregula sp. TaxID=2052170 RepID=UPI003C1C132C